MPQDKMLHFFAGLFISLLAGWLALAFNFDTKTSTAASFLSGTTAGVAKEVVWDDMMGKGTPEVMDAVATTAGSAIGSLVIYIASK